MQREVWGGYAEGGLEEFQFNLIDVYIAIHVKLREPGVQCVFFIHEQLV